MKLLQIHGSVDGIYENIDAVEPPRVRELLRANEDQAKFSREMATIVDDVPIELELDACCMTGYEAEPVLNLFRELEFHSLIDRLPTVITPTPATAKRGPQPAEVSYRVIDTVEALDGLVEEIRAAGRFAFDAETTGVDPHRSRLVGIAFSTKAGTGAYVPVGHTGNLLETPTQLPLETLSERLAPLFVDSALQSIAHNAKFHAVALAKVGVPVGNLSFDTMIAGFLLNESSLALKAVAFDRLEVQMTPIQELIGTGSKQITISEVNVPQAGDYASASADMTLRLHDLFDEELQQSGQLALFSEVEMPLVSVLTKIELAGVAVDNQVLREQSQSLGLELQRLEREIYDSVGHSFNLNSPKQLSSVLFEELNLGKTRKTSQGFTTDAASLDRLRGAHPMIESLLEYRQLAKIKSTYLDSLPGLIDEEARVHTSFNQCGAATGRISSSDPNLQNIPVRTQLGRNVRRAFVARIDGRPAKLVSADYSQIELRILAHISREPQLVEAFLADADIHIATAATLFACEITEVTADQRRLAKTINFGTIYGLSAPGLAQRTDLSHREAADFIKAYFGRYPGIEQYVKDTIRRTKELGYAETLLGRRRYLPDINANNFNVRSAAERMAINHPIQGSNADIIKMAMKRIQTEIEERRLGSRMVLQVHDELIFECPEEEVDAIAEIACRLMPASIELCVPVKVDVKVGDNWGELEVVESDAAIGDFTVVASG